MIKEITKQEALKMLTDGQRVYYLNPESLRLTDLSKVLDGRLLVGVTEESPKQKSRKEKVLKVDVGKVKALHDAGWSATKIADEMGVTPTTIYYHLKRNERG